MHILFLIVIYNKVFIIILYAIGYVEWLIWWTKGRHAQHSQCSLSFLWLPFGYHSYSIVVVMNNCSFLDQHICDGQRSRSQQNRNQCFHIWQRHEEANHTITITQDERRRQDHVNGLHTTKRDTKLYLLKREGGRVNYH